MITIPKSVITMPKRVITMVRYPHPAEVQLCVDALLALRATAATQAGLLKTRLLRLAASAPYRPIVAALCTHPGVGPLSAIRFVLEIGDIHRFARADSIAHYLGLTPSEYSSGDRRVRGRLAVGAGVEIEIVQPF